MEFNHYLLKGVSLAYGLYRSPSLRPRADTDLLVRDSDLRSVARILMELGYSGPDAQTCNLTSYECPVQTKGSFGADPLFGCSFGKSIMHSFSPKSSLSMSWLPKAIEIPALASCARGLGYARAFTRMHAPLRTCPRAVLRWWKTGICRQPPTIGV